MYEYVVQGRVAPVVPIYAPVPSNFDPSLAPNGGQLITACAVAPTTESVGRWNGKMHVPAVSAGQTTDQVGNRRPPVHTPVRGLYTRGCGAGARGVGTELAAASGQEAADRVVQDRVNGLIW